MIHWAWLFLAGFVGCLFGFMMLALLAAGGHEMAYRRGYLAALGGRVGDPGAKEEKDAEISASIRTGTSRAASLEKAVVVAGRLCSLRQSGFCFADCSARVLCNVSRLTMLDWDDLPERYKGLIYVS
jgi:hypothetical protein